MRVRDLTAVPCTAVIVVDACGLLCQRATSTVQGMAGMIIVHWATGH
jgi:hypothetical protein